jgi:hypothetical protein
VTENIGLVATGSTTFAALYTSRAASPRSII